MALPLTYEKRKTRQHYSTVLALDPHDGEQWDVLISPNTFEWASSRGMGSALELAYTVRWALQNPRAIFQGVRDDDREIDEEDWLCYVARPNFAYNLKTGAKVCPAWTDEVFLVFVTEERVVYLWFWGKCDAVDDHLPIDYEGRFRERVWQHDD